MKEKFIGTFLIVLGVIAFIDVVRPLDIGLYHIRPYILPAALLGTGWLELHARGNFKKHFNVPHILILGALGVILLKLWITTHR